MYYIKSSSELMTVIPLGHYQSAWLFSLKMALLGLWTFAALTIILVKSVTYIITSWQLLRKQASRGCKDPPIYPCRASPGFGSLVELLAADRANMLCEYVEGRVSTVSEKEGRQVDTFIVRDIGGDKIFTSNPQNVKAVLATQFKEFELGKVRLQSLLPLLGSGIVSMLPLQVPSREIVTAKVHRRRGRLVPVAGFVEATVHQRTDWSVRP